MRSPQVVVDATRLAAHMHDATTDRARPVVVVVEDEPLVRMHAAAMIESAGFDTVEAGNADEAIAILEARKDIRIVFTDVEMPGSMDGLRLARAIRDRWPPVELVLTSGRHPLASAIFRSADSSCRSRTPVTRWSPH
jgi:CheY-like chemotaxis protein